MLTRPRRWYLSGPMLSVELQAFNAQRRKLNLRIPERLLTLCFPGLTESIQIPSASASKTLCILVPALETIDEIEIPGLEWAITWLTYLIYKNRDLHAIPRFTSVKRGVILLRACQMLRLYNLEEGISSRIVQLMAKNPLTPDEVRIFWHAFRTCDDCVDVIASSLAQHGFVDGARDTKYIQWVFADELDKDQRLEMYRRIAYWKKENDRDREEREWRRKQERNVMADMKRFMRAVIDRVP